MGDQTAIAWTDHTFNVAWGCTKVSPGCKHCYAEEQSKRFGDDVWGPGRERKTFGADHWARPLTWNRAAERESRRHRVFSSSMADIWEDHPTITRERERLWAMIRRTPCLDWQLLTKRPERIAPTLPPDWGTGYPNVWLGVSIENNQYVSRADHLRRVPAVVRFISYEPALGALLDLNLDGIHWVIYGGESGPNYRSHNIRWARDMRDRCAKAGVAFFYKQSPARYTERGITLDGEVVRNYPTAPGRGIELPLFK